MNPSLLRARQMLYLLFYYSVPKSKLMSWFNCLRLRDFSGPLKLFWSGTLAQLLGPGFCKRGSICKRKHFSLGGCKSCWEMPGASSLPVLFMQRQKPHHHSHQPHVHLSARGSNVPREPESAVSAGKRVTETQCRKERAIGLWGGQRVPKRASTAGLLGLRSLSTDFPLCFLDETVNLHNGVSNHRHVP